MRYTPERNLENSLQKTRVERNHGMPLNSDGWIADCLLLYLHVYVFILILFFFKSACLLGAFKKLIKIKPALPELYKRKV